MQGQELADLGGAIVVAHGLRVGLLTVRVAGRRAEFAVPRIRLRWLQHGSGARHLASVRGGEPSPHVDVGRRVRKL